MPPTTEAERERAGFRQDWRLVGWLCLAVLALVQVAGLYTDAGPGPEPVPGVDKVGHALMFGAPAFLARLMRLPVVLGMVVVHAVVSEPLQAWVAVGRSADVWDLVADLVGIGLGVVLVDRLRRRRR